MHIDHQAARVSRRTPSQSSNIHSWSSAGKPDTGWALLAKWTHVEKWAKWPLRSARLAFIREVQARWGSSHAVTADRGRDSMSCKWSVCVWSTRRSRTSTQFARDESEKNRGKSHSCKQTLIDNLTTDSLAALHCACPAQTAGRWSDCRRPSQTESVAIAVISWAWSTGPS